MFKLDGHRDIAPVAESGLSAVVETPIFIPESLKDSENDVSVEGESFEDDGYVSGKSVPRIVVEGVTYNFDSRNCVTKTILNQAKYQWRITPRGLRFKDLDANKIYSLHVETEQMFNDEVTRLDLKSDETYFINPNVPN